MMEHSETFKWFATLGVGGVLAAFMFLFHRKDSLELIKQYKEHSEQNRQTLDKVLHVIQDNTAALTKVVIMFEAIKHEVNCHK